MKTTDLADNFINTLFCTYNYFKVWDRRQLHPTYTRRISSYQHLGLWPRVDNNNILLIVGFNYNLYKEKRVTRKCYVRTLQYALLQGVGHSPRYIYYELLVICIFYGIWLNSASL